MGVLRIFLETIGGLGKEILSLCCSLMLMEALSRMLNMAAFAGQFSGFSIGSLPSTSSMVSHLLFANDTLIFCDVDPNQLATLKVILTRFEEYQV